MFVKRCFASRVVRWPTIAACAVAAGLLSPPSLHAASPSLGSITPYGAQRGTEVEVSFNGARLADAQQILLYSPGVAVQSLEATDNAVKTKLAIAADCRLGQHAMRVRAATGTSELRTFYVGALPEIKEAEPNSEFTSPQKIALDTTVNGVVENEDVDYFQVEAKKGERITAEIEGIRLGYSFFDPYVAILDIQRFELSSSDDAALVWQDGVASIVAPEDGSYVIQVRETAYGGSGGAMYRLHVGRFPRPRATVPAGGKFGESVDVRLLGDVAGERVQKLTLPAGPTAKFGLFAQDEHGTAPSPNVFRLSDLGNVLEAEPNADAATATPFEPPMALGGVISEPGDIDCFKFTAKKGQQFDVRVLARGIRSPLDPVLNINRIGGAGVAGNDDSGGPDSYVRLAVPEDDQYVIYVQDHLRKGGPDYAYRVEIAPVKPRLVMGLPERQQFVDITVDVPQGNRTAALVSASRADFGGDLAVDIRDMPAGVTIQAEKMPANQTILPVLFTARADAPLAGALADVVGRHADPNQNIEGHLEQTTSMVRGQNNINVWTHLAERMAMSVTQSAPFSIDIVQPRVPLVRDGSMELKLKATRKEGFAAPITVSMLYNPPGVGSPSAVTIPEGQNEVVMPLTANGGAEVRTWKIATLGSATVGNGTVTVSSQLADLEISEPFVAFAYNAAAVEKGKETDVAITVTKNKEFDGPAKAELLGLPNEVTSTPGDLTKESKELVFHVKTTANSPAGKHKTLLSRVTILAQGEPITHMIGTGELRVDEPLPPKANEPAAAATTPAQAPAADKPPEKRLTRLEQLRLYRQKAQEAAKQQAGQAADSKPQETTQATDKPAG
jgi:hypothetical protein